MFEDDLDKYKLATPPIEAFRAEFADDLTPAEHPYDWGTGLITPDGVFYKCVWAGHGALADILCEYLDDPGLVEGFKKYSEIPRKFRSDYMGLDYLVCELGWLAITNQEPHGGQPFAMGKSPEKVTIAQKNTVREITTALNLGYNPLVNFRKSLG